MVLRYLFNSTIKEVYNANIILKHLSLEIINKRFDKKKLNLITLTNFIFKTLAIHGIKVITKLDGIIY